MEKILLGMSGGVDSSAAALVLKNSGYTVAGVTLRLCPDSDEKSVTDAKSVCKTLGIEHYVLDLKEKFRNTVIENFITEYKNGNTPNPCIVCNNRIKFGEMLDFALKNGFDKIATGHYARVTKENSRSLLLRAEDKSKDQSYVLYGLNQEQLSHIIFPLCNLTKLQIREIAQKAGLACADRKDSQDICFVPDGEYAAFIERTSGYLSTAGNYVDVNGKFLGKNKGVINYTIGQRKGLGIALGKPQFVISKDAKTDTVVLGDEELLFKTEVEVKNVNFIPFDKLEKEMRVTAKLRYRHSPAPAIIKALENGNVLIEFDTPQRAPSSGQSAVFYDGDMVVGGGIII